MSNTLRNAVRTEIATCRTSCERCEPYSPAAVFGSNVFSMEVMRERLPKSVFTRFQQTVTKGGQLHEGDADIIALAMKEWAMEKGATHYTHWFHPMTGTTAEKHDAFIMPESTQTAHARVVHEFSGKTLVKGESDASSFPSGGIRSTFEARGYTAWDPSSPAFIVDSPAGKTLYIPTIFLSYTGESLDRKTPLLRSVAAVSKQALRVLKLFGNTSATYVNAMVGAEQEYFLVDRRLASLRDDLKLCGRTVFGAPASKGQELEDHYYGAISNRVLAFMADVDRGMLVMGIPARTRHNEVAPAQFELAPLYEPANIATDHNMLTMEILRSTAEKHGFVCLLHEKPFKGVNGSGKHNNWSLCDSDGNNLLDPGSTPLDNAQFLVFLAAILRAVHQHSIALRLGTIGAGNDHRLGANEAPPAIISVFLGEQLTSILKSISDGKNEGRGDDSGWVNSSLRVGVNTLPPMPKDVSDRNRTSPFAFTGNKFEFRAVGSSQSIAPANIALNAAVACALDDIATELESSVEQGMSLSKAVQTLLAKLFTEHMPILFNGNGYSDEWQQEAARRGLPNLRDTVSALKKYSDAEVMDVFLRHGVLTERELLARQEILLENYIRDIHVETKLVTSIGKSVILPVCLTWLKKMADLVVSTRMVCNGEAAMEQACYEKVRKEVYGLIQSLEHLERRHEELDNMEGTLARAEAARDVLIELMAQCRAHADTLEMLVDDARWPIPRYNEMLWQH